MSVCVWASVCTKRLCIILHSSRFNRKKNLPSFFCQHTKSTMSTTLTSNVSKWKIVCYTLCHESVVAPELSFPSLFCWVGPSSIHQQTQREGSNITSVDDRLNNPNAIIINQIPALCRVNGTDWPRCNLIPKLWEKSWGWILKSRKTFKCYSGVSCVEQLSLIKLWRKHMMMVVYCSTAGDRACLRNSTKMLQLSDLPNMSVRSFIQRSSNLWVCLVSFPHCGDRRTPISLKSFCSEPNAQNSQYNSQHKSSAPSALARALPRFYCVRVEMDGNEGLWLLSNLGLSIMSCWLGRNIQTLVPDGADKEPD